MRPRHLLPLLLAVTACVEEVSGPRADELYVLQRIGNRPLPTWLYQPDDGWLIVADSLFVPAHRGRTGEVVVIVRVQVHQAPGQPPTVFRERYRAETSAETLVVATCPVGAACAASLVYAPFILKFEGGGLREVVPEGSLWEPRVYTLARWGPRPR